MWNTKKSWNLGVHGVPKYKTTPYMPHLQITHHPTQPVTHLRCIVFHRRGVRLEFWLGNLKLEVIMMAAPRQQLMGGKWGLSTGFLNMTCALAYFVLFQDKPRNFAG